MQPGTHLGHYEVTDLLGKGGMGEVYRARDTKLGREVAIKVLPSEFSRDEERLARLEREARMLASLNHPNIAAIYGLEQSEETRFLVLELVEGDTLADRIKRGAMPVEEALKLALQTAEALEAAHESGVIHRDLKPANIKVTPDGKVKVLDFGLAKAFIGDQADVNLSNSPTLSMQATQQGVILGTTGVSFQLTENTGSYPLFSRDGGEMFYRRGLPTVAVGGVGGGARSQEFIAVDISLDVTPPVWSNERVLPIQGFQIFSGYRDYDITRDGERLLMIFPDVGTDVLAPVRPSVSVVQNWLEEIKERVPIP